MIATTVEIKANSPIQSQPIGSVGRLTEPVAVAKAPRLSPAAVQMIAAVRNGSRSDGRVEATVM